jgi:membrane protein DedA with SNARE-associated domain
LVFNQFTEYVANASGWAYAAVFLLALLDAILPVVPSETAVITAGVVEAVRWVLRRRRGQSAPDRRAGSDSRR